MADNTNPFASMTDEQLDALIAQGQTSGVPTSQMIVPEGDTSSEMKGLAKAGGTGLLKGATDVAGLPGDIQSLAADAFNKVMPSSDQQSTSYGDVLKALKNVGAPVFPSSQDVQKTVEGVTGPFYQPQTGAEKVISAAGEAVPFGVVGGDAMLPNMARAALSGGASEAAGQATEGTSYEIPARIGAGMLTYGGSGTLFRPQINPTNVTQAAAQGLENSGVPIRASDISGSRLQRTLEGGSPPSDRPQAVSDVMQQQGGIPIPPGNTQQYGDLVSQRYKNDLQPQIQQLEATTSVPVTPALRKNLRDAVFDQTGVRAKSPAENQQVVDAIKEFNTKTQSGVLSGPQYNDLRQRWGASGIPNLQTMAGHLDDAMDAAHPGVWPQLREDQANYAGLKAESDRLGGAAAVTPFDPKTITGTMYKKTPMYRTAEDAQTINASQPQPYDFHTLSNIGHFISALASGYGMASGAAHGGVTGAAEGGLLGLGPEIVAKGVPAAVSAMSPAANSWAGQRVMRNMDPRVVAALLAQQGVSKNAPTGNPQQVQQ